MSGLVEHEENTDDEAADIKLHRENKRERTTRVKKAWAAVVATPEGRAVLWDVMAAMGMMKTPLEFKLDGSVSVELVMVNIGRQDYARKMFAEIGENYPAMLALMQKENI